MLMPSTSPTLSHKPLHAIHLHTTCHSITTTVKRSQAAAAETPLLSQPHLFVSAAACCEPVNNAAMNCLQCLLVCSRSGSCCSTDSITASPCSSSSHHQSVSLAAVAPGHDPSITKIVFTPPVKLQQQRHHMQHALCCVPTHTTHHQLLPAPPPPRLLPPPK